MEHIIGIGEYGLSCSAQDTIKTFALSSCVAITFYDPIKTAAGMVHIVLPSPLTKEEETMSPYKYASTAIPLLLKKLSYTFGCNNKDLEIQLFGGADSVKGSDVFRIGQRNIKAVLESLERLKLKPIYTDLGGKVTRTLEMYVGTGRVVVITQPITF